MIRHRRLEAFFKSKVLNSLMIVIVVCLLLMAYTHAMLLPVLCGAVALSFFVAYSLWLWIWKPKRVVVNSLLSDTSGLFTLYFIVVLAMDEPAPVWYVFPAVAAVVLLFITMVKASDEMFEIN